MLIMNLLILVTMIGFGSYFIKKVPKEINAFFGYRISRSMKNKDTWNFAHHYCGRLWCYLGWIMFGVSVIAMILVIGKDADFVGDFGGILCSVQTSLLIVSIFPTEAALKRTFDEQGHRRK